MDIISIFTLVGGLAFFLYGMNVMGSSLEKLAGGKLERVLEKLTNNPFKGALLGALVTGIIQSSSATTVMVVGFVNSGLMSLKQAVGVIMGANIGTTITSWILSLMGIESTNLLVRLFKPDSFAPILAFIGIILLMTNKKGNKRHIGEILVGFGVLIFGMTTMSDVFSVVPQFSNALTMFSDVPYWGPILGILVGLVVTCIIQSSSASVGILQAISLSGGLTYATVIPILLGQNIGTCVSALISSIGANKKAKQAALVHFYFNLIGKSFVLIIFYILNYFIQFKFMSMTAGPVEIAIAHSAYSIFAVLLFFPFQKWFVKLAEISVKDKDKTTEFAVLDERFFATPGFAVEQCNNMAIKMAELVKETLFESIEMLSKYDPKKVLLLEEKEEKIDLYEDKLGSYLVKLGSYETSEKDSNEISKILHSIGDLERIGDHAKNILEVATELHDKQVKFSDDAAKELETITNAIIEIVNITMKAYIEEDTELAVHIEPLEQVIDDLTDELKARHIRRLRHNHCTIEIGFIYSDLLDNYERVSDHCSNIAVCIIQTARSSFDAHMYLNELKNSGSQEFANDYRGFRVKYELPERAKYSK